MKPLKKESLDFILQTDLIESLFPSIGRQQWQILYSSLHDEEQHLTTWCALLDDKALHLALANDGWDLSIGSGRPGFSTHWEDGKEITTYHRFNSESVRPFVWFRSFSGAFPEYFEFDQEFRLYHDLAHDKKRDVLLSFDSSGREIIVARLARNKVEAQLKHIKQFLAGTQLHLAVYVDSVRYTKLDLQDFSADKRRQRFVNETGRWSLFVNECDYREGYKFSSRLLGKIIIPRPRLERAGIWPFEKQDNETSVNFIIGVDENGHSVEHTSNHHELANYFGANPNAPHYLTPVFFRREVLTKYFSEPDRYSVEDGVLSCLNLWSCRIDNDLESHVVVFLGDLGRDLPYEERLHWRQFNVAPSGSISKTNFKRSFLAHFTDAESLDFVFRNEYKCICEEWQRAYGWPLFLPPSQGDTHLINTIRIPLTNSQSEFDEQIGHLTKLLIDSLNELKLSENLEQQEKDAKGISKLEIFFEKTNFKHQKEIIQFMRDLQTLRSTGSAHRKGSNYEKILEKLSIDLEQKPAAFRDILNKASEALVLIRSYYCDSN